MLFKKYYNKIMEKLESLLLVSRKYDDIIDRQVTTGNDIKKIKYWMDNPARYNELKDKLDTLETNQNKMLKRLDIIEEHAKNGLRINKENLLGFIENQHITEPPQVGTLHKHPKSDPSEQPKKKRLQYVVEDISNKNPEFVEDNYFSTGQVWASYNLTREHILKLASSKTIKSRSYKNTLRFLKLDIYEYFGKVK